MNKFKKHPNEVGMSYIQHLFFALNLSSELFISAVCSFIHAFFPFYFTTYSSDKIRKLNEHFTKRNSHE